MFVSLTFCQISISFCTYVLVYFYGHSCIFSANYIFNRQYFDFKLHYSVQPKSVRLLLPTIHFRVTHMSISRFFPLFQDSETWSESWLAADLFSADLVLPKMHPPTNDVMVVPVCFQMISCCCRMHPSCHDVRVYYWLCQSLQQT